ncbi:unnamed protein product [Owenia fusiformis]|uniref:Uncharacterized protein n=1 Tax=Owenia fusiformis TaxID=6347 RepID=A0A8J1Y320_OWEFU|nr:unnamed protein product [Owenia fusiformis]
MLLKGFLILAISVFTTGGLQLNDDLWELDDDYRDVKYSMFTNGTTMLVANGGWSLDILDPMARKITWRNYDIRGADQMAISPFGVGPLIVSLSCPSYDAKKPSTLIVLNVEAQKNQSISIPGDNGRVIAMVVTPKMTCTFLAAQMYGNVTELICYSHVEAKPKKCQISFPVVSQFQGSVWYPGDSDGPWVYTVWVSGGQESQTQHIYKFIETDGCLKYQRMGPIMTNTSIYGPIYLFKHEDNTYNMFAGGGESLVISADSNQDMKIKACLNQTCGGRYQGITEKTDNGYDVYAIHEGTQQYDYTIDVYSGQDLKLTNVLPFPKGAEPDPNDIFYNKHYNMLYTAAHYWDYGINGSVYAIGYVHP